MVEFVRDVMIAVAVLAALVAVAAAQPGPESGMMHGNSSANADGTRLAAAKTPSAAATAEAAPRPR